MPVGEEDIDQMFDFADKDKDGKINYRLGDGRRFFFIILCPNETNKIALSQNKLF